ncbi:MAG: phage replisome organizer N-terminal domain-containing protein [bacterium]
MNKKKSFYISTDFYKDKRIKSIDKPDKDKIMYFWLRLVTLAAKYNERENLKNCLNLNRKKLPDFIKNETQEFINLAIEILEKSNLLDIKSISNIVKFEE